LPLVGVKLPLVGVKPEVAPVVAGASILVLSTNHIFGISGLVNLV
jgi:hypothetical protein